MIRERPIYRGDKYKSLNSGNPLFLDLSSLPLSPPYTYPVSPQLKKRGGGGGGGGRLIVGTLRKTFSIDSRQAKVLLALSLLICLDAAKILYC